MKFKFPLQKVLQHRKTVQDLAQKDFQLAQADLQEQIDVLDSMIEDLAEARREVARGVSPAKWQQIHEFTILQDRRIQDQRAKVEEARKLVEEKREILRLRAIDSKMMERLKERRKEQFLLEQKAAEQKDVDELNILRFELKEEE